MSFDKLKNMHFHVASSVREDADCFTGRKYMPGYRDDAIELEYLYRYASALSYAVDSRVLDIARGEIGNPAKN